MSWEQIRGWFDFEDVYDRAIDEAPHEGAIVEIGVAYGKSLAYLARKAIDAGRPDILIIGVDPWESVWGEWDDLSILVDKEGGAREAFEAEMARYAPEERQRVTIWQTTGVLAAKLAPGCAVRPSFVFIDGRHEHKDVAEDIAAWLPLIRPGGVIAGHDHTPSWPGVETAVREAFPDGYEISKSSWIKRLP